jgi:hypothetical protein
MKLKRGAFVVLVLLAIGGFYANGNFDRILYNVGLNFHECARNGFGATFCGKELDQYRERISRVKQEGQEARAKIESAAHPEAPAETTTTPSEPPAGHVTVARLPASTQLEATITVGHSSCTPSGSCDWFGEASQYPLSVGTCPSAFDTSHAIWTGPLQSTAGTIHQAVAFQPAEEGPLLICLYTHDATLGDQFVYGLREKVG